MAIAGTGVTLLKCSISLVSAESGLGSLVVGCLEAGTLVGGQCDCIDLFRL